MRTAERARAKDITYTEAVRDGLYPPLGSSDVRMADIVGALENSGYTGWYVMEQDIILIENAASRPGPPTDVAESLAVLRRSS